MKIAVLGCGAIGSCFLGYISQKGIDVTGVVRQSQQQALLQEGLIIEGVRGSFTIPVKVVTELKEDVDLAILATKIDDLEEIINKNKKYLKKTIIVTTQNGVRADYFVNKFFPAEQIVTCIVMFGATFYAPNRVVHNFDGECILGSMLNVNHQGIEVIKNLFSQVFKTVVFENIKGAKYLKVFCNLNNCIPAILGVSIQEAFADMDIAKLAILFNQEAYQVVSKSGIELASIPTYPKERLQGLLAMPIAESGALLSQIMTTLSKEPIYGSILQSIQRQKKSEIDYINGEIVKLAQENGLKAPLNERIVELVHQVENTGKFFTKEELIQEGRV